jgi:hypothetical protein
MSNGFATRLCAAGGAVYVVLGLATTSGNSDEPTLRSSRAEIAQWAAHHPLTNGTIALAFLTGIALISIIPFASVLKRVLGDVDSSRVLASTMYGSALVWVAVKVASAMPEAALRWRGQGMSPQVAATLHDMGDIAFATTWLPQAVFFGCAAAITLRSRVLPRFLGWLAALTSVLLLAGIPVANVAPPVGMLLSFVWLLVTSIVLVRRGDRVPVLAPATA